MDNMPIEIKIAGLKNDLVKYLENISKELELPPTIIVGVLSDVLNEWKTKELVQLTDLFNSTFNKINEELLKGNNNDVQN